MGGIHLRKCSIRPGITDSSSEQKLYLRVEEGSECMFLEDLLYVRHLSKHHTEPPCSLRTHRSLRGGTLYCSCIPQGPECCCAHRRHLVFNWQLISFKCFNAFLMALQRGFLIPVLPKADVCPLPTSPHFFSLPARGLFLHSTTF